MCKSVSEILLEKVPANVSESFDCKRRAEASFTSQSDRENALLQRI